MYVCIYVCMYVCIWDLHSAQPSCRILCMTASLKGEWIKMSDKGPLSVFALCPAPSSDTADCIIIYFSVLWHCSKGKLARLFFIPYKECYEEQAHGEHARTFGACTATHTYIHTYIQIYILVQGEKARTVSRKLCKLSFHSKHKTMKDLHKAGRAISFQPAKLGATWISSMSVRAPPEPFSVSSRKESCSSARLWADVEVCKYLAAILVSFKICVPLRFFRSWSCLLFETWCSERSLRHTAHAQGKKTRFRQEFSRQLGEQNNKETYAVPRNGGSALATLHHPWNQASSFLGRPDHQQALGYVFAWSCRFCEVLLASGLVLQSETLEKLMRLL
jgi:hypothetical protein